MRRATVVTVAGGKVTDLLNNFIINHARLHVAFPLLVHCLDENVLTACRTFAASVHSQQVLCLRARCCTAADGRLPVSLMPALPADQIKELEREAVLTYKLKAALDTLLSTHAPVILLDLDALILRAECFDEWLRIPDDIVLQVGGHPGCPANWPFKTLGLGLNTGAMLVRPSAAWLLSAALSMRQGRRYPGALSALQGPVSSGTAIRGSPTGPQAWASRAFPYRHHCYEQELMVMVILAADPQWRRFPFEMSLSLSPAPYHNLHPRIARGARGSTRSWRHFMSQQRAQHQGHQLQQDLGASRAQEDWQFLIGNALHDDRIMAADEALRPTASSLESVLLLRFLNYSRWAGGTKAITVTSGLLGPAIASARDLHDAAGARGHGAPPEAALDTSPKIRKAGHGFEPAQATAFPGGATRSSTDGLCLFHAVGLQGERRVEALKRMGLWRVPAQIQNTTISISPGPGGGSG